MKRITALFLIAALLCASCFTVSAASQYIMNIRVQKWDAASGSYVSADTLVAGDVLQMELDLPNSVPSVSALRLKIHYDSNMLEYTNGSAQSGIDLGTLQFTANTTVSEQSYVLAYWVKPAGSAVPAVNVAGTILKLKFRCIAPQGSTVSLQTELLEAYDGNYKGLTFAFTPAESEIPVEGTVLTAGEKEAFEKLKNIAYPISKGDIEAADALFDGFSAAKQVNFKNANPELFAAYQNAWAQYWELAQNNDGSGIEAEIEGFLNAPATKEILALTPEGVNAENFQKVLDVFKTYEALSGQAKARLDPATADKLTALQEAAKNTAIALENAQIAEELFADYIKLYEKIWGLSDETVRNNCDEEFIALIKEARASYDELQVEVMSAEKANLAKSYLAQLEHYQVLIEEELAKQAKEAEIEAEVSSFVQKWADVLKLNLLTTTLGHEYAVKMMMADYEKLSDAAKDRLMPQKEKGEQLLALIQGLKSTEPGGTTKPSPEETTEPSPGETTEPSPGETTEPSPGETTEPSPGETTEPSPEETMVPGPGETPEPGAQVQIRELPAVVKIMLIAMFASLLSLAFPATLYWIYRKKYCERSVKEHEDTLA